MKDNLSHVYVETLRIGLKPYFANWLPNEPLTVGDFGYLDGCMFSRKSSLKNAFGKSIQSIIHNRSESRITYMSSKGLSINSSAIGSIDSSVSGGVPVKAHLDINFSKEGAVYFNATKCKITEVNDLESLGNTVLKLFESDQWNDDWAVVISVVKADSTTALVSSSNDASIVLEADASIPKIDLADASIKLNIKSQKNIGFSFVTKAGCVPLFTLGKIKPKFLGGAIFKTRFLVDGIMEDSLKIKREHVKAGKDIRDIFVFEELADI